MQSAKPQILNCKKSAEETKPVFAKLAHYINQTNASKLMPLVLNHDDESPMQLQI